MKELSVGVIGCGALAQATHLPHLNELEGARLKWACDVNPGTLAEVAAQFRPEKTTKDFQEVIDDPEVTAVVLATAMEVRLEVIEAAARVGKAVYCEKPVAYSVEEMEGIQKVVEDSGIVFCVGHNRRSSPAMIYAREVFLNQRHNPTPCLWRFDRNSSEREHWPEEDQTYMVIRINDDLLSWKSWVFDSWVMDKGPMLFEMTHFIDLACWFLESRPVSVTSVGHHRTNHTVVIEFEDGSLTTILETGVGTFGYPKELYEVFCNGSAVILDHFVEVRTAGIEGVPTRKDFPPFKDPHPEIMDGGGIRDYYAKRRVAERLAVEKGDSALSLSMDAQPNKGHKAHLARFLDAARGLGESPCPIGDSILATRIAFAAIESHKAGRAVGL